MPVLRIEHTVADFDTWKERFDADPADRRGKGVRSYQLLRSVEDPNYVMVDLELDTEAQAHALLESLQAIWERAEAQGLVGPRQVRIADAVDSQRL